jgi:chitinase
LKNLLFLLISVASPNGASGKNAPRFRIGRLSRLGLAMVLLLSSAMVAIAAPATTPVVVAYVFPRTSVLTPDQVDAHKLTRINFAFANIQDGRIIEGAANDAQNLSVLVGLKRENPSLTVLVSVGGWIWSGRFSDMALTSESRSTFIDSVVTFVEHYQLDGLDIDWEYPGQVGAGNTFRPADKQNYTLLVKELRARFLTEEKKLHRQLYITVATGASIEFLLHTEMDKVQRYVDTINLMSYDYYEPGDDKVTGNHAPLFTDPADPKRISADRSVHEFEQAGVPAGKLVLGVPFYGHVWGQVPTTNNGLFQPGQPVPNAYAHYGDITSSMLGHGYTRYWDAPASAPYLYSADQQTFVSYEDPESLTLKCGYILSHHLAGIMFWEYTNDPSGTLLGTIHDQLQPSKSSGRGR